MRSYLHIITHHQAYIEKVSLWNNIKQNDLETRFDHAPACVHFIQRRGMVTAHLHQESRYIDRKGKFIYKALTLHGK